MSDPSEENPRTSADSRDDSPGWIGLAGIGTEFVGAIIIGGAIGWWLDRRLGTLPWLTIAGAAIGFAAGLVMLVRAGRRAFKD